MTTGRWPAPAGPIVMPYGGVWPRVADSALILPGAAVVGDVEMAPDSSVWFNAVVRGDDGPIRIGRGSNVQDGCVVHVGTEHPTVVGDWVTLGHNVHLHACRLHDETLIGSSATVLDGAVVERHAQVAAGALVAPNKVVGSGELWGGVPARKLRDLTLGHNVHLHACRLHDETLIGSSATVLDGAVVERHAQVAAGALVAPNKVVGSGELWGGVPARKLRDLRDEEIATIRDNAEWYVHELDDYRRLMEETA